MSVIIYPPTYSGEVHFFRNCTPLLHESTHQRTHGRYTYSNCTEKINLWYNREENVSISNQRTKHNGVKQRQWRLGHAGNLGEGRKVRNVRGGGRNQGERWRSKGKMEGRGETQECTRLRIKLLKSHNLAYRIALTCMFASFFFFFFFYQ